MGTEWEDPEVTTGEGAEEELTLEGPITLDLTQISDEPVSRGWHTVTIERAEGRFSRKKHLPEVFFLSRITDEGDPEHNRTVIWNCQLKGDGLMFTKRCFKALGMPEVLNYPTVEDLCAELVGLECEVEVRHKVYQGAKQARVSNWRPVTMGVAY